jgi:CDP-diacylglycerol--glycerol-3-phosphate 3-phosphatidyltransferase
VPERPARPEPPSRQEYLREWSALHGDAGTGGLVGWWLGLAHALARPLIRLGAGPDAVTLLGLLVALAALPPAAGGGRWPVLAAVVVAVSGLLDNLDGAIAVMAGRVTRQGFVLDSVCDRVAEACYGAALWLAGAPAALVVAGVALAWLHEYTRARAAVAGMPEIGVVTVAERPTRVIVTAMFLLGAGLYPAAAGEWALAGAAAWAALATIGAAQLALVVHRRLT